MKSKFTWIVALLLVCSGQMAEAKTKAKGKHAKAKTHKSYKLSAKQVKDLRESQKIAQKILLELEDRINQSSKKRASILDLIIEVGMTKAVAQEVSDRANHVITAAECAGKPTCMICGRLSCPVDNSCWIPAAHKCTDGSGKTGVSCSRALGVDENNEPICITSNFKTASRQAIDKNFLKDYSGGGMVLGGSFYSEYQNDLRLLKADLAKVCNGNVPRTDNVRVSAVDCQTWNEGYSKSEALFKDVAPPQTEEGEGVEEAVDSASEAVVAIQGGEVTAADDPAVSATPARNCDYSDTFVQRNVKNGKNTNITVEDGLSQVGKIDSAGVQVENPQLTDKTNCIRCGFRFVCGSLDSSTVSYKASTTMVSSRGQPVKVYKRSLTELCTDVSSLYRKKVTGYPRTNCTIEGNLLLDKLLNSVTGKLDYSKVLPEAANMCKASVYGQGKPLYLDRNKDLFDGNMLNGYSPVIVVPRAKTLAAADVKGADDQRDLIMKALFLEFQEKDGQGAISNPNLDKEFDAVCRSGSAVEDGSEEPARQRGESPGAEAL